MTLTKQYYPDLKETVYRKILDNGLEVVFIHKPDYQETLGIMAVRFGALDTIFRPKYRKLYRQFPAGIAHFLEHKLFEMSDGSDAVALFSNLGAEVNAFTSYQQTVYYFSTTDNVKESLQVLQKFTETFHITQESLEREQSIISQEINMYQDDPDYQLYMGLLKQLYPESALSDDIAGTLQSLEEVNIKDLKMNFDLFYQPSNKLLLVVGPENPEDLLVDIEAYQAKSRRRKVYEIDKRDHDFLPVKQSSQIELPISGPKLALGFKGNVKFTSLSIPFYRLAIKLFFAMALGWTSSTYQEWYEKGRLDDSFQMEIEIHDAFQLVTMTLDTHEPLAMSNRLRQLLKNITTLPDFNQEHLDLVKQELYGDFLKSLNSLEQLAMHYVDGWIGKEDGLALTEMLDKLSLEDVLYAGQDFIKTSEVSDFIIFPQ
ncbi:EF-P 5-aminopentanol modification-associated protein YfmH [Streptococcus ovuberis]|uniref:Insulinase family protein n=1 Tax=Streptococcus ovuberis TaxID=1936207 RepID=A0A7X6N1Q5_9STRE|nr:pitrilysin family protein [Streptococcus ovuberis]NKZ20602.1 insulinase family protein [Streptococcus ovuberis]